MPVTNVAIIEDHPIFSKGLTQLINTHEGFFVIGEATCCSGAMALVESKHPDLVIVDLNLGDEDGLELIKNFKAIYPSLAILVLSMHDERYYAERVLRAGARGYIMKEEAGIRVIEAIETVMSGKIWLSEAEREHMFSSMASTVIVDTETNHKSLISKLSDRQLQILNLIGKGLGTVEISTKLNLSAKTVGTHKEHIKQKLGCASIQELRHLAIKLTNS